MGYTIFLAFSVACTGKMKKYHIETYGCEMNKAESAAMETTLREHGWERSGEEEAELILLNTCTVRATAENRAWNRIHQLSARKKSGLLCSLWSGAWRNSTRVPFSAGRPAWTMCLVPTRNSPLDSYST